MLKFLWHNSLYFSFYQGFWATVAYFRFRIHKLSVKINKLIIFDLVNYFIFILTEKKLYRHIYSDSFVFTGADRPSLWKMFVLYIAYLTKMVNSYSLHVKNTLDYLKKKGKFNAYLEILFVENICITIFVLFGPNT